MLQAPSRFKQSVSTLTPSPFPWAGFLLMFAVENDRIRAVDLLLQAGAKFEAINIDGQTAFSLADLQSNVSMAQLLLS